MKLRARLAVFGLAVAGFLVATGAVAQDPATGEVLFNEAIKLMEQGKTAEACVAFAASHRADAALGTLLNLASCHEKQGRVATAWAEFLEVERKASAAGQGERASVARDLAQKLEPRLPRLKIRIAKAPSGLIVKRDETVLDPATLGIPLPLDLGEHELVAEAPGRETWRQTVTVDREGTVHDVSIPELAMRTASMQREPVEASPESSPPVLGWVLTGSGAALLATGGVLGFMTLGEVSDAEDDPSLCPRKRCSPDGLDAIESAENKGIAATVLLGTGVIAAAVGVYVLLAPEGPATTTTPLARVGQHGVAFAF